MPTYVYGIAGKEHPLRVEGLKGVGEPARELRVLTSGQLGVVVSDAPEGLRAKRRDVMAHQGVLEHLLSEGPVLPMRFGLVAPDDEQTIASVREREQQYTDRLAELDGCREYNVKVSRDEDDLLRQVLAEVPEARRLNELARERPGDRRLKMELGELAAQQAQARQQKDAARIMDALTPAAVRTREAPATGGTFLNVSFLVDRKQAAAFAEAVHGEAERCGDAYAFRTSGPLPPYSFV
ncbi:GvpL/GvpF family gas vesicle protein [Actinacidiphila guanduensis]|uniref:Gas vesicle synthesis protein GvpL/GvpF n=1 Tax=Actinacidiphila guanduensis TaxID=310781 RepID=A0A1H0R8Q4_9ACTN|nr:GvpL/GvpF family gas vesicle protein [Actinacidiphila guanduensis]SDP25549.1 Gas vesicle synthesis protein GvpL/GvpF [Actinacidiphila guanduensis]